MLWPASRRAAVAEEIRRLKVELDQSAAEINKRQQTLVDGLLTAMEMQVIEALQALVKEEGVSMLLKESAVYHADDYHNLTDKLAAKLSQ
ncbi:MAG: hypothetical protein JJ921_17755 [Pseudomonadales bacterium]|nr:hypothetical protein [Pseudomonadales bacterium]MBO7005999.1 hypothetical protein [Pseudomonadales bacterium]